MLFVPGNNSRMIAKAYSLSADGIIFDLEDSVPLQEKATARDMVRKAILTDKDGEHAVFVRINALLTDFTAADIESVVIKGLNGVLLSKTETNTDITKVDGMLEQAEVKNDLDTGTIKIIPIVETAKGVINAYQIASASPRILAVSFGAGDYYRDMGRSTSSISPGQVELLFARSQVVIAGRAAGVPAIDTVFFGAITDLKAFREEAILALQLGYKGKFLIHPSQIDIANEIFSPSADDIAFARKIVEAFEEVQRREKGATSLDGKMIDYMTYQQAKDVISFAQVFTLENDNTTTR